MHRGSALVVSVAVHVIAAGGLAMWAEWGGSGEAEARSTAEPEAVAVTYVEVPPGLVEVTMLDEAQMARIESQTKLKESQSQSQSQSKLESGTWSASASASATSGTATAISGDWLAIATMGAGSITPGGESALDMQRPPGDHIDPTITGNVLQRIAENGKPLPPPVFVSGHLTEKHGGKAKILDHVIPADIDSDGQIHFHDTKPIQFHLLPSLSELDTKELKASLKKWADDPYHEIKEAGKPQDLPQHVQAIPGAGCEEFNACPPPTDENGDLVKGGNTVPLIGGRFEITDALMKHFHAGDPYASKKRALMAATFDERAHKNEVHRKQQLDHSSQLMHGNLEDLWRRTADAATRKEALFELWDECSEGDDSAGVAGQRARAEVIGWIRTYLPKGAAGAFTDAETAAFARRKSSKQEFTPYE